MNSYHCHRSHHFNMTRTLQRPEKYHSLQNISVKACAWRKLWIWLWTKVYIPMVLQRIVCHLSRRIYKGYICPLCDSPVDPAITWLSHLYSSHPVTLGSAQLSEQSIVHLLSKGDNQIFNIQFPSLLCPPGVQFLF